MDTVTNDDLSAVNMITLKIMLHQKLIKHMSMKNLIYIMKIIKILILKRNIILSKVNNKVLLT